MRKIREKSLCHKQRSLLLSYALQPSKCTSHLFQRLVNKVFASQMGKNLETYIDDIIVKSKEVPDYVSDLREMFEYLRKF